MDKKLLNDTYMRIALEIAQQSTCARKQVACVLVKDRTIISTGYNGVPSGMKHCNETFTLADRLKPDFMKIHGEFSAKFELHAEQNAVCQAAKNEVSPVGSTAYVTLSPCAPCAKLLIAAGVKEVYYYEAYDRDTSGIDLLKEVGIPCNQITLASEVQDHASQE